MSKVAEPGPLIDMKALPSALSLVLYRLNSQHSLSDLSLPLASRADREKGKEGRRNEGRKVGREENERVRGKIVRGKR